MVQEGLLDGLLWEGLESFIPGGQEMLWQLGDAVVDMGRRLDSSGLRDGSSAQCLIDTNVLLRHVTCMVAYGNIDPPCSE